MKASMLLLCCVAATLLGPSLAAAHCEIPCGIFDDELRLEQMDEDITTVDKAMKQVAELSPAGAKSTNQIVRWVVNKEEHAQKIQDTVARYFMAQRIKPADPQDPKAQAAYVQQLTLAHQLMVAAMKAKQTTDAAHIETLRKALVSFRDAYLAGAPKK